MISRSLTLLRRRGVTWRRSAPRTGCSSATEPDVRATPGRSCPTCATSASPISTSRPSFAAREGSTHGYDVIDPTRFSDALGGEAGFRALAAAAREAGPRASCWTSSRTTWPRTTRTRTGPTPSAGGVLRPRRGDRPPPALLRDRPPRRRAPGGPGGVRRDAPAGARARREGPWTGCGSTTRTASPTRPATSSALRDGGAEHVWVEKILDPGERLRAVAGRGHRRLRVPRRRRGAVRRPGRRAAADRAVGGAGGRRAAVRRVGGRGQARAGRAARSRRTSSGCGACIRPRGSRRR